MNSNDLHTNIQKELKILKDKIQLLAKERVDKQVKNIKNGTTQISPKENKIKMANLKDESRFSSEKYEEKTIWIVDSLNKQQKWIKYWIKKEIFKPSIVQKIDFQANFARAPLGVLSSFNGARPINRMVIKEQETFRENFEKSKKFEDSTYTVKEWEYIDKTPTEASIKKLFNKYRYPSKTTLNRAITEIRELDLDRAVRKRKDKSLMKTVAGKKDITGTLVYWNTSGGYGFIDYERKSYFVHFSSFQKHLRNELFWSKVPHYVRGQEVLFNVINTRIGRYEAYDIRPVNNEFFDEHYAKKK